MKQGICSICGEFGQLTFEHVPPKSAFNDRPVLASTWDNMIQAQTIDDLSKIRKSLKRKGAGAYTLCGKCNSETGAWYVPAFTQWAWEGAYNRELKGRGTEPHPFLIRPLEVLKATLAMFASAVGPTLFQNNIWMRKFVLDKYCDQFDPSFKILSHYLDDESSMVRQSGVSGLLNLEDGGRHSVFSEITCYPICYLLNFPDSAAPNSALYDISSFAKFPLGEYQEIRVPLNLLSVNSMFPGDYRKLHEIYK